MESVVIEDDALIDSGASGTFIPRTIADNLGLIPNNFVPVQDFEGTITGQRGVYTVKVELGTEIFTLRAIETNGYSIVGRDILNKHKTLLQGIQQKWEIS